jgi:hypothetical protein
VDSPDDLAAALVFVLPAVLGLAAFAGGVALWKRRGPQGQRETVSMVIGIMLILFGLCVGACYGFFGLVRIAG